MALQEELKRQGDFLFKHRSLLPLIILGIGLSVYAHSAYYKAEIVGGGFSESFQLICLGVSMIGFFVRAKTVGHTPFNTSGRNTVEGQIADELNTTGPYSLVRHPLYVGNFFMWLGVAMLTENAWFIVAFILFYYLYYERIMYAEESFLRTKFETEYLNWSTDVPAFVPTFKKYITPNQPFSLRKVFKQEKNGFTALFLLFWLFNCVGDCVEQRKFVLEYDFWFYAAISSFVLYLILKFLKKRRLLE